MDKFERQMALNRIPAGSQKEMLQKLFDTPGELQRVEDQVVEMIEQKKANYTENSLKNSEVKQTSRDKRAQREF